MGRAVLAGVWRVGETLGMLERSMSWWTGDVVRRLRWQDCGTASGWVKLADGVPGTARKVRSVMLVG